MSGTTGMITKNFSESITAPEASPVAGDELGEEISMTAPAQYPGDASDGTGAAGAAEGDRRRGRRRLGLLGSVAAAAMLLVLGVGQASAPAAHATEPADGTDVPNPAASSAQWQDWSEELFVQARSTDWAADSAQRGCELISVDIVGTTVPEGTWEGSPAGLEVPVINRDEDCSVGADGPAAANAPAVASSAARAGSCSSTSGPGTICLSRASNSLTASFTYRGSGSPEGFIRLYARGTSAGCDTGSTLATSSLSSYQSGQTRSVTGYAPGHGPYSASFWHDVWLGSTNWGTVCRTL